jgi:sarcosine oxidase
MASEPAHHYNTVVIGGGAVGLAAAVEAAERGESVAILEQATPLHEKASSGGAERQWRVQYAEEDLTRLTLQAEILWTELEQRGGRRLIHRTGSLWFGDTTTATNEGQVEAAVRVLDRLGLPYRWMNAQQIEQEYHFAQLPGHYEGFFQPDGGMTDVRATLWLLLEWVQAAGVHVRWSEQVLELEPDSNGVTVTSERGGYRADHVIVAAGAFTNRLLRPLGIELKIKIYEMTTAYFRIRDAGRDYPTWFAFQEPNETDSNLFYGFGCRPWAPNDLVKVAPDFETDELEDPSRASGSADPHQLARTADWVAEHLPGLDPTPLDPRSCLIALPRDPDRQFYVGLVPGYERIAVYASGWGFKFVPLLARTCVQLVLDGLTEYDFSRASLSWKDDHAAGN